MGNAKVGIVMGSDSDLKIMQDAVALIGTPITGKVVTAARTPPKCAAAPAPAMITCKPRSSALSLEMSVNYDRIGCLSGISVI